MSTKILVAEARARFNHVESKQYLKEKYTNLLTIAYAGGMWTVDRTLISFLDSAVSDIMIDIYGNPIRVNRQEFLELAQSKYNEVMSAWLTEYETLPGKR